MVLPRIAFWTVLGAFLSLPHTACASVFALNPQATYLHINGDVDLPATAVKLSDFAASSGDFLLLQRLGDFSFTGVSGEVGMGMTAVFSSSPTLDLASSLNRVLGAIEAGSDVATDPTFLGSQPTDISQDFAVTGAGVVVQVPIGALYIFFSPADSMFNDNLDVDNNWAVNIERVDGAVPEAASITVWGGLVAVAGASLFGARRR